MKRLVVFVMVLWAVAPPAGGAGQALVGTVVEQGTRRPVVGAVVRLMADSAWTGVMYLTSEAGSFSLEAPGPGTYSLRVERIGFASTSAGPFALRAGEVVTRAVSVAAEAVRLEGLEVSAERRRCTRRDEGGAATQTLWTEARKALTAASWTERRGDLSFRVAYRQRKLDPRTTAVLADQGDTRTMTGGNSVRSLPPEQLARDGYVQESDGLRYFYGPDAEALLSDAFLGTHCLAVEEAPEEEPNLVGLRFEPLKGRDVADIKGVLWMDRASGRLTRIDYRYTDTDLPRGEDLASGQVRFAELSDGRWMVRDWYIRAPLLTVVRSFSGPQMTLRTRVDALLETGASVESVTGEAVAWSAQRPPGAVEGSVFDSLAGRPLREAEVRLAGRGWRAVTDADGRFELAEVPPGTYRVTFRHPRLDSLGIHAPWRDVTVEPGSTTELALAIPVGAGLAALRCPIGEGAAVVGKVLAGAKAGGPGGVVVSVVAGLSGDDGTPTGVTDAEGWFWICGLPTAATLTLVAQVGGESSAPVEVTTASSPGPVRVDLELGGGPGSGSAPPR